MNVTLGKTEFTDVEHAALRRQVEDILHCDADLTKAEIARQADLPASTFSQYLSDTYPSEPGKNTAAVAITKWLESRKQTEALRHRLPVAPPYLPLRGSNEIKTILAYSRALGRMSMICGSPGVGKTVSARRFKEEFPRTWLATMDPSTRGVNTMLVELLAAMGHGEAKGAPQTLVRQVRRIVQEAQGLIIIDEAQHLSEQAIEALRGINDAERVGIALMGNETAWQRVGATGMKAAFAQVSSRFAQRKYIVSPNPVDVEALARAWADANDETIGRSEVAFCQTIAARPGGLRNIEMTFEGALIAARGANETLSLDHLQAAFGQLSGRTA